MANTVQKHTAQKHIGETRTMNCGLKATIIAYRHASDIDVQFENKAIRKHMAKINFIRGEIAPTKDRTKTEYIKETRIMKCGLKATIIEYRNSCDIDVQFENGIIRQHMTMSSFKRGAIKDIPRKTKDDYIGMTKIMTCGMKAKIIDYRGIRDIDVQFEDHTVRKHVKMNNFKNGSISPLHKLSCTENEQTYVNTTRLMKCGLKATCIKYRHSKDIDVQFENNEIREHVALSSFLQGAISPKNHRQDLGQKKYLNQTLTMHCGMKATIIVYRKHDDIDVQFEDGTIVEHTRVNNFKKQQIRHDIFFNTYHVKHIAFTYHDTLYFDVTYTHDNIECHDIMSIDDMKRQLHMTNSNRKEINS